MNFDFIAQNTCELSLILSIVHPTLFWNFVIAPFAEQIMNEYLMYFEPVCFKNRTQQTRHTQKNRRNGF